eukprot:3764337-Amphidinium_carterae.1
MTTRDSKRGQRLREYHANFIAELARERILRGLEHSSSSPSWEPDGTFAVHEANAAMPDTGSRARSHM